MNNYHKTNVIAGWIVFAIATITYVLTIEPTASFWDTGEFIASAYKLEVGHPPGAPFFMLMARLFSMFVPAEYASTSINVLSALCSSFTILFLFWTITHMAKKLLMIPQDKELVELTKAKLITILGAGAIGALAYTFSDSFWFSAVEGEVYAMSSLFTAIVFWAILKWESVADKGGETRWIIFIAYLMGLSIGVHLLNLLAIPAIAFVYYFKRYTFTWKGAAITGLIAVAVLGLIQGVVITGTVNYAAKFELFFVNTLGLPFHSGVIVYALVVIGGLIFLLRLAKKRNLPALHISALSIMMLLIGYSTFTLVVVRSAANPPMDENNPENLFTLLSYLSREQYGDRPLLFGEYWNSPVDPEKAPKDGRQNYIPSFSVKRQGVSGDMLVKSFKNEFEAEEYVKNNSDQGKLYVNAEYVPTNEKKGTIQIYKEEFTTFFPRMYSTQANHIEPYKEWSDFQSYSTARGRAAVKQKETQLEQTVSELQQIQYYLENVQSNQELETRYRTGLLSKDKLEERLKPEFSENFRFFTSYQVGWMYFRYFLWNFAGKQNDIQGHGDLLSGNWLSGVDFIDQERLGNRDQLPSQFEENKGFNKYLYLPLLLGLIGLIFQLLRHPKDFSVVTLLFLLTGLAIVVYLNQTPMQPRERDYAYVGSFYAFCIWIGLSLCALYYAATRLLQKELLTVAAFAIGFPVVLYLLESLGDQNHAFSYTFFYLGILGVVLLAIPMFLGKAMSNKTGIMAAMMLLLLVVPFHMGAVGWDDHNRAKRRTATDFAKNYLDSLEPNAILFTNGDNDTFPLWYVQEVEGYRTDVRIVNLSLLNTDWYIDQMKRKAYESDPVPFSIEEQQYRQGTRDLVLLNPASADSIYTDVLEALEVALDDSKKRDVGQGRRFNYLPTDRFSLPVDMEKAKELVPQEDWDKIVDEVQWRIPKQYILKSSFMVLDMLSHNNWERPIYFAVTTGRDAYMGLADHFLLEGLAYKLVPAKYPKSRNPNVLGGINEDAMYDKVMNEFQWGNMDYIEGDGIYMDENNRRMTTNLRLQMSTLADELIAAGKTDKAQAILNKTLEVMPEKNVPFDRVMIPIIDGFYAAGDTKTGDMLAKRLYELNKEEMDYYISLGPDFQGRVSEDMLYSLSTIANLEQMTNQSYNESEAGAEIQEGFRRYQAEYEKLMNRNERVPGSGSF